MPNKENKKLFFLLSMSALSFACLSCRESKHIEYRIPELCEAEEYNLAILDSLKRASKNAPSQLNIEQTHCITGKMPRDRWIIWSVLDNSFGKYRAIFLSDSTTHEVVSGIKEKYLGNTADGQLQQFANIDFNGDGTDEIFIREKYSHHGSSESEIIIFDSSMQELVKIKISDTSSHDEGVVITLDAEVSLRKEEKRTIIEINPITGEPNAILHDQNEPLIIKEKSIFEMSSSRIFSLIK